MIRNWAPLSWSDRRQRGVFAGQRATASTRSPCGHRASARFEPLRLRAVTRFHPLPHLHVDVLRRTVAPRYAGPSPPDALPPLRTAQFEQILLFARDFSGAPASLARFPATLELALASAYRARAIQSGCYVWVSVPTSSIKSYRKRQFVLQ